MISSAIFKSHGVPLESKVLFCLSGDARIPRTSNVEIPPHSGSGQNSARHPPFTHLHLQNEGHHCRFSDRLSSSAPENAEIILPHRKWIGVFDQCRRDWRRRFAPRFHGAFRFGCCRLHPNNCTSQRAQEKCRASQHMPTKHFL